jgi:hypothetical protein
VLAADLFHLFNRSSYSGKMMKPNLTVVGSVGKIAALLKAFGLSVGLFHHT